MASTRREVTLREAAEAIVTHCYNRRSWSREDHVEFAERQLRAAVARGRREALLDSLSDGDGS